MEQFDVIIVGGSAAGLTAALYTARRALKTLIITKAVGGQMALTTTVENYPGTGEILGPVLAQKFREQAESAGAKIEFGEVTGIMKNSDGTFIVQGTLGDLQARAVIFSFGLEQRRLGVPGEKELTGRGVAYCAICDGPLFRNKVVAVVGGGNSALDAAEYLAQLASQVYLIVRDDNFNAEATLIEAVTHSDKIKIHKNSAITEIIGNGRVEKIKVQDRTTEEISEINLNGVFIEIGWQTKTAFLQGVVALDDHGYVKVDRQAATSTPGIFAAGDLTDGAYKQIVIAAGEGAKAAMAVAQYLGGNIELK